MQRSLKWLRSWEGVLLIILVVVVVVNSIRTPAI